MGMDERAARECVEIIRRMPAEAQEAFLNMLIGGKIVAEAMNKREKNQPGGAA